MLRRFGLFILVFTGLGFTVSNQDLINAYCGGKSPCYICSDGNQIKACARANNSWICPLTPKSVEIRVSDGYTFKIMIKGHYIKTAFGRKSPPYSNWVNIYDKGNTKSGNNDDKAKVWIETDKGKIRLVGLGSSSTWVKWSQSSFSLKAVFAKYRIAPEVFLEKQENRIRICIKNSWFDSKKCSPWNKIPKDYTCYNVQTVSIQNEDTPEGFNDKQNTGKITSQGCLGQIYIFNGHDYRCRPPGLETGFSNCCKKTTTWFGLGRCSSRERILAKLRAWGQLDGKCHYVGSYCASKVLGVCIQRKKTYCCFSSPLARIIQEQGRKQLGISWGSPKSPNCRGFTPEEFQKLDFSKMDFSEWINEEVQKNIIPNVNTSLSNAINNLKTSVQTSVGGQ